MAIRQLNLVPLLLLLSACAEGKPHECFVNFRAYDAVGAPVGTFQITSAKVQAETFTHRANGRQLLGDSTGRLRLESPGNVLRFSPKDLYHLTLLVSFEKDDGSAIEKEVPLYSCTQRESIVFGEQVRGSQALGGWFVRHGHLKGCVLDSTWWARSSPLFGTPPEPGPPIGSTYDAYIEPATGEFAIRARRGVRHMIIVGRGRELVKALAVNVEAGSADEELGEFDLSDSCPPTDE